jgi:hypothetical protein
VLRAAAAAAAREPSAIGAIDAGWAVLNANRRYARRAFRLWAQAEQYDADLRGLGAVLRRRYRTAAQVAHSLRTAAGLRGSRHGRAGLNPDRVA